MSKLTRKVNDRVLSAVEEMVEASNTIEAVPTKVEVRKDMTLKERMRARLVTMTGYGMIGVVAMQSMGGVAFADGSTLSLTSLKSVLDFIGNIIIVVGVALAGWNVVQAGQQMKETGGLQFNQNVWGVIGGIAMAIGGGAMKSAANLWKYGDVAS